MSELDMPSVHTVYTVTQDWLENFKGKITHQRRWIFQFDHIFHVPILTMDCYVSTVNLGIIVIITINVVDVIIIIQNPTSSRQWTGT